MLRNLTYLLLLSLLSLSGISQAGIYTEGDIELQDMFIEAQLEKHKNNTDAQIALLKEVTRRDKSAHAAYYELSRAYFLKEDNEAAEANIRKAIQLDPGNEWYHIQLIDVYEAQGNFKKAIDANNALIQLFPDNMEYIERLAFYHLKTKNVKAAIDNLLKIQNRKGIQESISKKIFNIYDKEGETDKAIEALETLSSAYPGNVRFMNNLAGYLLDKNQKEKALEIYEHSLEIDPDNSVAHLALSREKSSNNSDSGLNTIAELIDNNSVALDDIIQELVPYMANMSRDGAQTEQLVNLSEKLIERFPNEAKTMSVRADILFYSGQIVQSEKLYESAVRTDDSKFTLWDQWLLNLWELGNYTKMMDVAMDAIDLFPNQVNAYFFYSVAAFKRNDKHEALDYLAEAKLIAGKNENFQTAHFILDNWMNLDKLDNSSFISSMNEVKEINIYNPMLFDILGEIYLHLNLPEKTREYWRKAINFGADKVRIEQKMGNLN